MPILNSFNPSFAVNTGTDTITIGGHGLVTAQGVVYSNGNGTSIGGLVDGYKYYVIFVDALNFKLANTEVEARAGTAIDLLSTGTGTTHLLTTTVEYPNSAAYYDFFRKFRFIGTGIVDPEGYSIEADNVRDTLTIIGGTNIVFSDPQSGVNDTITINGPDYDIISPTGVTNGATIRLENVGVEYHDLKLTSFRGIRIERIASNEIGSAFLSLVPFCNQNSTFNDTCYFDCTDCTNCFFWFYFSLYLLFLYSTSTATDGLYESWHELGHSYETFSNYFLFQVDEFSCRECF
jgi:hypothetical protein